MLLLAACAPLSQRAGRPGAGFAGPRLESNAFVSFDGTRLGLQQWRPAGEPWAVVVGLHGMNDYANTFHLAAEHWARDGIATWAYDQRGFGRSPGRGVWGGRELMDQDLRTFCALIRQRYPHAVIAVVGVSMGGAVAIDAFASNEPPAADRLVLASPAVWGWSSQPLDYRVALWLAAHSARGLVLNPPSFIVRNITASDNIAELRRMGEDPLLIWGARPDALYGLVKLMQRAWAETGALKAPTLYLYGAKDQIVPAEPAVHAAAGLGPNGRTAYYADGYHLLLIDLQNPKVWDDVEAFVRSPAAPLPSGAPPIPKTPPPAPPKPRHKRP
jgi:alpha-beta hydrolase superfamily lysophospholipase